MQCLTPIYIRFFQGEFRLDVNNGICEIQKRVLKKKIEEQLSTKVSWKFNGQLTLKISALI